MIREKLTDLDATFVGRFCAQSRSFFEHETIEEAQGILFICPKCRAHSVLVWFANPRNGLPVVPTDAFPGNEFRWTAFGETVETLSLKPSVDLSKIDEKHPASPSRCYWHGLVEDGYCT